MSEQPKDMKIPLYLMGLITSLDDFKIYSRDLYFPDIPQEIEILKGDKKEKARKKFVDNQKSMSIRDNITEFFTRISKNEIKQFMTNNTVVGELYESENFKEINDAYNEIQRKIEELKSTGWSYGFGEINKKRQEIEYLKVPIFVRLSKKYIEEGKSVIIFMNYLDPMEIIRKELTLFNQELSNDKKFEIGIINGKMKLMEKFEVAEKFQKK